jgi:aminoglycoside phosphotransferase (APT) family kinase protein
LDPDDLSRRLVNFLQSSHGAESVRIENLRLLTGGASRQTWSFDAVIQESGGASRSLPLVLRSDPRRGLNLMSRDTEYALLRAAGEEDVPVPRVHLMGDDSLDTPFFLMERVEGETIARRLLRDDAYAQTRDVMTAQLGRALAAIHRIPVDKHGLDALVAPPPGADPAAHEVDRYEQTYRAITPDPHPTFELAFRWLRQHLPPPVEPAVVHGDFRIGNIIFGPDGLRAVLDWELAHIGDSMEDLGWLCVRSWRFGNDDLAVGGIGAREELWRAYEAAGGAPVHPDHARFWEVFGNLRWGIITITQAKTFLDGFSPSVELAAIGRRTAETEWELLNLMEAS